VEHGDHEDKEVDLQQPSWFVVSCTMQLIC
jgi:hypothetical protein